jgi:hypothetical protein
MPRPVSFLCASILAAVLVVSAACGVGSAGAPRVTTEDHFLSGSVGSEGDEGVPYWIWLVLPRIFPEHLPGPGGYASLGLIWKEGEEIPIGFSRRVIDVPRVEMNCAACHTTSVRTEPDAPRMVVPGGPGSQTSAQQYMRFLFACASDPRFTADIILAEIARNARLSLMDRIRYRTSIIPKTRERLLALREQWAWSRTNPEWGSGRSDQLNALKYHALSQPLDQSVGTADSMPLWNTGGRRALFWDGVSSSLRDVIVASAIAGGTSLEWIDDDLERWDRGDEEEPSSLLKVRDYIARLQPPRYPYPVDAALSAAGAEVFVAQCASCHEPGAARFDTVIPIGEIGTDRQRLDTWTRGASAALDALGEERDWRLAPFRTSEGYMARPLDGLWLRAPYLHNGSVPTLADLLAPADMRPVTFRRGIDLYDPVRVGFVSTGPAAEGRGTLYDTNLPGNSNAGHLFGVTLSDANKRALIEYLKTR